MRIGNTPAAVTDWLLSRDKTSAAYRIQQGYMPDGPSSFERAHFGVMCPRCYQQGWLCLSETGLPASRPHIERTLVAARESEI